MAEEVSVAQARLLLRSLYEHVNEVSISVATVERKISRATVHASALRHQRRHVNAMRRDLYEAHRLIDGLHQRFPATRDVPWPSSTKDAKQP